MTSFGAAVKTVGRVTPTEFGEEIYPGNVPVLMKAQVGSWPAVQAGLASPQEAIRHIKRFDRGQLVDTNFGSPDIEGRFFYNERLDGLNFTRKSRTMRSTS